MSTKEKIDNKTKVRKDKVESVQNIKLDEKKEEKPVKISKKVVTDSDSDDSSDELEITKDVFDGENSGKALDVKKKGRKNKEETYRKQREATLAKLNEILEVVGNTGIVYIDDITEEKTKKILSLVEDVRAYFNHSSWTYFKSPPDDRPIISFIKGIYGAMDYDVRQHVDVVKQNGVSSKKHKLCIVKNRIIKG
jgi:hypothetical protein